MDVTARQHWDRWKTGEPVRVEIDVMTLRPPAPRRREAGEVSHRRAGRENPAPRIGKAEELLQPAKADLLTDRAERRRVVGRRVLIPRRREPVRRERRRRVAADD